MSQLGVIKFFQMEGVFSSRTTFEFECIEQINMILRFLIARNIAFVLIFLVHIYTTRNLNPFMIFEIKIST